MTSTRNFDLVVFDWDGTLFDSTALITHCIQAACTDLGVPVPSDAQASYVIGMGLIEALQHAAPDLPRERYRELGERYRHHYSARQHRLVFFDGTLAMLHDLKARGHLLAVATGKSRRGLDDALNTSVLRGLFDATRTADETASKPDPRMLVELMDEFGIAPELPPARYRELGERYRHHYDARQHEIVFFDGTLAMVQALKARGHLLGVATGKSRRGLDDALDTSVLRGLFDATRTADETASKPDPRMLLELMALFQLEPARTLMIGDTTHDLQLAANARTASIGVSYGAHDHLAFEAFDTLHVAHSTADLHDWLIRHG